MTRIEQKAKLTMADSKTLAQPLAEVHAMAGRQSRQGRRGRRLLSTCRRRSATPRRNISPRHIPGAVFFDIDAIADHSTDLPHMLPGPDAVRRRRSARSASPRPTPSWSMTAAGSIRRRGCGGRSAFSAPRTSTSSTAACRHGRRKAARSKPARSNGTAEQVQGRDGHRRGRHAVATCRWRSTTTSAQVVDARSAGRFPAARPEPRAGPALRPHAGREQRAVHRDRRERPSRRARKDRGRVQEGRRRYSTSRSSPAAAPASPRRCWRSASTRSASRCRASTTAPGPNGARPDLPVAKD